MYDVMVLVEEELSLPDAEELAQLYAGTQDPVRFHILVPSENAKAEVEASLTGLAGTDLFGMPSQRYAFRPDEGVERAAEHAQAAADAQATAALTRSIERLKSLGREADGTITHRHPVDELVDSIPRVNGQEVVVVTRPHVVAELLHVDWSAQARRHLGVPVLHLLEQQPER
jgi:hypothetical protein